MLSHARAVRIARGQLLLSAALLILVALVGCTTGRDVPAKPAIAQEIEPENEQENEPEINAQPAKAAATDGKAMDKEVADKKPAAPKIRVNASTLKSSLDRGANFLIDQQLEGGAYGFDTPDGTFPDVGITAMVLFALAECPRQYRETDGPFISRAVEYLQSHRQPDGGVYQPGQGLRNYKTSVTMLALSTFDRGRKEKKYADWISGSRDFVAGLQCSEDSKVPYSEEEHKPAYGGIGYGSDRRPDLSNTQFALEALHAAGLAEDSDVYKRALVFLERCQNLESNDLFEEKEYATTDDGGFMYSPGTTKAEILEMADGGRAYSSYGSMTYAGLKSFIYAGLTKEDPRVAAAWEWIGKNYTVTENPNMASATDPKRGWMGLYYYYVVMARTLDLMGEKEIVTADGKKHRWAEELAAQLLSLQRPDGSWVNEVDRWWEGSATLTTAYAVQALSICKRNID